MLPPFEAYKDPEGENYEEVILLQRGSVIYMHIYANMCNAYVCVCVCVYTHTTDPLSSRQYMMLGQGWRVSTCSQKSGSFVVWPEKEQQFCQRMQQLQEEQQRLDAYSGISRLFEAGPAYNRNDSVEESRFPTVLSLWVTHTQLHHRSSDTQVRGSLGEITHSCLQQRWYIGHTCLPLHPS